MRVWTREGGVISCDGVEVLLARTSEMAGDMQFVVDALNAAEVSDKYITVKIPRLTTKISGAS